MHVRRIMHLLLLPLVLASTGCAGGYVLRGRVIEGTPPGIHLVPAAELQQEAPAVAGARIDIHRDPDRLNRALVASGLTARDGTFAIPIEAFGAGWMDESWLIEATHGQFQNTRETLRLPADANRTRLLIIVAPGRGTPTLRRDDLLEEYQRFR